MVVVAGGQKLAGFRQMQKMPHFIRWALICYLAQKTLFLHVLPKLQQKN